MIAPLKPSNSSGWDKMKSLRYLTVWLSMSGILAAAPIVEKHPQKDLIMRSLQRLVTERAKTDENHFFFLKRKDGIDWVYWREGRLLWSTEFEPYYEKKGATEIRARSVWDLRLCTPHKPINLDTDVVAKPEDIGSSTYLVSKDFVAAIVYDCVQDGELVVVRNAPTNR